MVDVGTLGSIIFFGVIFGIIGIINSIIEQTKKKAAEKAKLENPNYHQSAGLEYECVVQDQKGIVEIKHSRKFATSEMSKIIKSLNMETNYPVCFTNSDGIYATYEKGVITFSSGKTILIEDSTHSETNNTSK